VRALFTFREKVRIALTYTLVVVETLCELALPALVGLAIDGVLSGDWRGLYGLVAGILTLIVFGSFRQAFDTRTFGHINKRIAVALNARELAFGQKVARIRLLDDFGQFFDTYLPQALGGMISTVGAVAVLFIYDGKVAAAALAAVIGIFAFTASMSARTARFNARINRRMEHEADAIGSPVPLRLVRHIEVLRRLRNARSDAETVMFAGGWLVLTGLIVTSIFLAASTDRTAGEIFAILFYVLAVADGFNVLPPMIERLTRTRDIIRRISGEPIGKTAPTLPSGTSGNRV
jgi:hypothetical protein